ncbi:MAG: cytochrome c3 family protein, partial [Gemmatimonadales bacterium]
MTTAKPAAAIASRHAPYTRGECRTCHGSDVNGAVLPDFMAACRKCHEPLFAYRRFGHSPAVVGACRFCHVMHESENAALLKSPERELCVACHPEHGKEEASGDHHQGVETVACT